MACMIISSAMIWNCKFCRVCKERVCRFLRLQRIQPQRSMQGQVSLNILSLLTCYSVVMSVCEEVANLYKPRRLGLRRARD